MALPRQVERCRFAATGGGRRSREIGLDDVVVTVGVPTIEAALHVILQMK